MTDPEQSLPAERAAPRQLPRPAPLSLADLETLARDRMPKQVWDYVAGGSGAESTLAANRSALDRVGLLPRVLSGVAAAATGGRLLDTEVSMPLAVAPMAYQRLVHPDGELAAARAAAAAGVPLVLSTLSSVPIEQVAEVGAATWFQLYWLREEKLVAELIDRAESAGCQAIVLTVDVPILGRRLLDIRNGFTLPADVAPANLIGAGGTAVPVTGEGGSAIAAHTAATFKPGLSWADLEWLRARTRLPLVVKGVLDPADAERAVELGVDAVVVSNHGGRQLDGAVASIAALPAVVDAVGGRVQVLLDSGIRTGTDILRALALGASGVLLGRPLLWGLATAGAAGAEHVLSLLHTELRDAMTIAGCADLAAARHLSTRSSGEGR